MTTYRSTDGTSPTGLTILQTCRHIFEEAEAIFFHNNNLYLYLPECPHSVHLVELKNELRRLSNVNSKRLQAIRSIKIDFYSDAKKITTFLDTNQYLPRLRELQILDLRDGDPSLATWSFPCFDFQEQVLSKTALTTNLSSSPSAEAESVLPAKRIRYLHVQVVFS